MLAARVAACIFSRLSAQMEQYGAPFRDQDGERAQVFLTNALTGWEPPREPKPLPFTELEEERDNAEQVKRHAPVLVVLGNPPYNSYAGIANMEEERDLSTAYRTVQRVAAPQGQGLNDLYVRFFRMAERRIVAQTGQGIVCFISNYSWLDGLSHTGMREHYLSVFDRIWIDNLNGDKYRTGKVAPDGTPDPSIFSTASNREGIQVGTAITLLLRTQPHDIARVQSRDLWGQAKRARLADDTASQAEPEYESVTPALALGLPFVERSHHSAYLTWPRLPEIFPTSYPGIKTSRDSLLVDIDRDRLEARMRRYLDPQLTDEQIASELPSAMENAARYDARAVRRALLPQQHSPGPKNGFRPWQIVRYCYRPFDLRWLYWEPRTDLIDRKREDYVASSTFKGMSLVAQQKSRGESSPPFVIQSLGCLDLMDRSASCFPMLLLTEPPALLGVIQIVENLNQAYSPATLSDGSAQPRLMHHALAVMHAPAYREENAGALLGDWPRIPLPAAADTLAASAALGAQLAALLDPETPVTFARTWDCVAARQLPHPLDIAEHLQLTAGWGNRGQGGTVMPARGRVVLRPWSPEEEAALTLLAEQHHLSLQQVLALFGAQAVDVYLNGAAWWSGVPLNVWEYTLGGYQVLKKWLSYRELGILRRPLTVEELRYFSEVVRRISSMLLLAPQLDTNYRACSLSAIPTP